MHVKKIKSNSVSLEIKCLTSKPVEKKKENFINTIEGMKVGKTKKKKQKSNNNNLENIKYKVRWQK